MSVGSINEVRKLGRAHKYKFSGLRTSHHPLVKEVNAQVVVRTNCLRRSKDDLRNKP